MDKKEVKQILEALANGVDPVSGDSCFARLRCALFCELYCYPSQLLFNR